MNTLRTKERPFKAPCPTCGRDYKKERSLGQNKRLWKIYTYIAEDSGHSTEEIHSALKELFLPKVFVKMGEKELQVTKSTTTLSTKEMCDYSDRVVAFAGEMGIVVPNEDGSIPYTQQ